MHINFSLYHSKCGSHVSLNQQAAPLSFVPSSQQKAMKKSSPLTTNTTTSEPPSYTIKVIKYKKTVNIESIIVNRKRGQKIKRGWEREKEEKMRTLPNYGDGYDGEEWERKKK